MKKNICLNPYSNGTPIEQLIIIDYEKEFSSLNPYSNGTPIERYGHRQPDR